MSEDKGINFTREAFLHPLNMGMLFIATLSAFFVSDMGLVPNIIFSMAFGVELVYLGTVPRLPRFKKQVRLKKLKQRDNEMQDRDTFQQLDEESRKRFLVLKHLSELIEENFDKLPYSSQGLLDNIRKKMDNLLSNYLNLLDVNQRYEKYVYEPLEDSLKKEIQEEEQVLEEIESDRLKDTKRRRIGILKKRLKKFSNAKEKYMICQTHLQTIEDAIRYIYEQSMTMNNPEEIGFQLDNLLHEVEDTSQIIDDLDEEIWPMYEAMDEFDLDNALSDSETTGTESEQKAAKPLDQQEEEGGSSSQQSQSQQRMRES